MLTVVYSTRSNSEEYKKHILEKSGLKNIEIIEVINNGEKSLSNIYNENIKKAKFDIVICLHDDLILPDKWGKTLLKNFNNYPNASLIGLAGNTNLSESGTWYSQDIRHLMCGQVKHTKNGNTWLSKYSSSFSEKLLLVSVVDGLFMAFNRKNSGNNPFQEGVSKFHYYDVLCSFNLTKQAKEIYVCTNILVTHKSVGEMDGEWEKSRIDFLEKNRESLPLSVKPKNVFYEEKRFKFKKEPKVNIIILSKDKNDLLFKCIDSILEKVKYNNYRIIIADTGSKKVVINDFQYIYGSNNKITLLEFDYYNFAKINNEVVKNYLDLDCELVLFCNNDIEFINDCLSEMLNEYFQTNNSGCIGSRLHYPDLSIQHSGIIAIHNIKANQLSFGHHGIRSFYNYYPNTTRDIMGVTGALLLIKKDLFLKMGMFDETYTSAFEDVQLNLQCILNGRQNIIVGNSVAIHAESQSRTKSPQTQEKEHHDMVNTLLPFVSNNFKKLEKYFIKI